MIIVHISTEQLALCFRRMRSHRIKKRIWTTVFLLAFSLPAFAMENPDALVEEAIRANPGLEAMRAKSQALSELANVAGTWEDPRIGMEYVNLPVDSYQIDESPMSGIQFKIEQAIPEFGWSKASREVADLHVRANEHATSAVELKLRRDLEVLFWQLTLSNLLEEVTRDHLHKTEELLRAVRSRYEVGEAGQNELLRLSVLRDRLEDDLKDFTRSQRMISAGISSVLARPEESVFDTPDQVSPVSVEGVLSEWIVLAKKNNPDLAQLREEVRIQYQQAELERLKIRPEVNVWMKYRYRNIDTFLDDGTDFLSFGVSVPIPLGSARRGIGKEASHLQFERSARARLASKMDRIQSDLTQIEAEWSRAFEKANVYQEELLPMARLALQTTLSDFSVGKADFSSLYESEVELLTLEKIYLKAVIETRIQRAEVRRATGTRLLGEVK